MQDACRSNALDSTNLHAMPFNLSTAYVLKTKSSNQNYNDTDVFAIKFHCILPKSEGFAHFWSERSKIITYVVSSQMQQTLPAYHWLVAILPYP